MKLSNKDEQLEFPRGFGIYDGNHNRITHLPCDCCHYTRPVEDLRGIQKDDGYLYLLCKDCETINMPEQT